MNPNSVFTSRDRKQPSNPHARKLDVEADLKPLLAFLQDEAGMTQEQVAKVCCWAGCLAALAACGVAGCPCRPSKCLPGGAGQVRWSRSTSADGVLGLAACRGVVRPSPSQQGVT